MSRIILAKYPGTDEQHIVVGWDRPLSTYYWQEFNKEPEGEGDAKWEGNEDWEEMIAYAGYFPNELPDLNSFMTSCPPKVRELVTEDVIELLRAHPMDPDTGSIIVDMTEQKEAKS